MAQNGHGADRNEAQKHWNLLAAKSQRNRRIKDASLFAFLIAASIPIIIPYFWLLTLAFSAGRAGVDTKVLWPSIFILVPAVVLTWIWATIADTRRQAMVGWGAIWSVTIIIYAIFIGPSLHLFNFRFLFNPDFNAAYREIVAAKDNPGFSVTAFPSVWTAFWNSLFIAGASTVVVVFAASLAGYYISRFQYRYRESSLAAMLVLHAFPTTVLLIPIFLVIWKIGLLDTLFGVMLVIVGIELPFAVFIMKGFFDAVPWEIEMSALTDGATRRQAFYKVVLPQVTNGMIAVAVFVFIRGWEEFIFVLTLLTSNVRWTMSLYTFFVTEETNLGVDYGVVSAVGVFYIIPSFVLYTIAQKYLLQMSVGGIKG
ncbi:MAG: carbohydrate ABC transporter permease [Albidovulum sp.]|nr:carbohydrate ABC transporter permease [Albidovulum sp.]MDE0531615.1 carbohydrate ABC transporter permease [Albidovulum sp.]